MGGNFISYSGLGIISYLMVLKSPFLILHPLSFFPPFQSSKASFCSKLTYHFPKKKRKRQEKKRRVLKMQYMKGYGFSGETERYE